MHDHNHKHPHDDHNHGQSGHKHTEKLFENLKTEKLPGSTVAITGGITKEALMFFYSDALNHFKKEVELPGFRKGHVPEKTIIERIGELSILERAGEMALQKSYPQILLESKIEPLGNPEISITKLALGSAMEFKIVIATFPEFKLPDYKTISKKSAVKEIVAVTEKEIADAIDTILKMKKNESAPPKVGADETPHLRTSEGEIPTLTDDFVKTLGKFENVADFKIKLKENILKEKELKAKEKNRLSIIKAVIEKTEMALPRVIVESELDRMLGQMKDDIERMGLKMPDYLKRINKTENDLRKDWEKDAIERAKMELIIDSIAREEKIIAPEEEVEKEVKHLSEHYSETDPIRAQSYFRHVIKNEKVFEFLENPK